MESSSNSCSIRRRSGSSYSSNGDIDNDHRTYKSYYNISGPIWFISPVEQVAEALLRCLGFRSPADHRTTPSTITTSNHHRQTPQSTSTKEEVEEEVIGLKSISSRSIVAGAPPRAAALMLNNRKPPRPPVSSGRGGKTNLLSLHPTSSRSITRKNENQDVLYPISNGSYE